MDYLETLGAAEAFAKSIVEQFGTDEAAEADFLTVAVNRFGRYGELDRDDFLAFYTWPVNAQTKERLNRNELPVVDKLWRRTRCDKGGFIQEATGWKPAILPAVCVRACPSSIVWSGVASRPTPPSDVIGRSPETASFVANAGARDRRSSRVPRPQGNRDGGHLTDPASGPHGPAVPAFTRNGGTDKWTEH